MNACAAFDGVRPLWVINPNWRDNGTPCTGSPAAAAFAAQIWANTPRAEQHRPL